MQLLTYQIVISVLLTLDCQHVFSLEADKSISGLAKCWERVLVFSPAELIINT